MSFRTGAAGGMGYRGGGRGRGGPNRGGGGRGRGGGRQRGRGRGNHPSGLSGREIGLWYKNKSMGAKKDREKKEVCV